jgi:hypothetical protein
MPPVVFRLLTRNLRHQGKLITTAEGVEYYTMSQMGSGFVAPVAMSGGNFSVLACSESRIKCRTNFVAQTVAEWLIGLHYAFLCTDSIKNKKCLFEEPLKCFISTLPNVNNNF